ncbi:PspA/IM30 family protein [Streptomyces sp. KL116D]|uniref:PspA/IM30 family protein n=1 Tax=Streptomyces sp. KL116D TaxID=3045152 RepID=UPI00355631D2
MTKQTILGLVTQLAKANINALLDSAEDPQKMLDQLIRDYTNNIEAEEAVATTIGNLRMMEQDHKEDVTRPPTWGGARWPPARRRTNCAPAGTRRRPTSSTTWRRSPWAAVQAEKEARDAGADDRRAQTEVVDKLKAGLDQMKVKLTELRSKRDQPGPRQDGAGAEPDAGRGREHRRPRPDERRLGRFEEKVRREEAEKALGKQELAASSLDAQVRAAGLARRRGGDRGTARARSKAVTGAPVASWAGAPAAATRPRPASSSASLAMRRPAARTRRRWRPLWTARQLASSRDALPHQPGRWIAPPSTAGTQPVRIAAARGDRREDRRAAAAMTGDGDVRRAGLHAGDARLRSPPADPTHGTPGCHSKGPRAGSGQNRLSSASVASGEQMSPFGSGKVRTRRSCRAASCASPQAALEQSGRAAAAPARIGVPGAAPRAAARAPRVPHLAHQRAVEREAQPDVALAGAARS